MADIEITGMIDNRLEVPVDETQVQQLIPNGKTITNDYQAGANKERDQEERRLTVSAGAETAQPLEAFIKLGLDGENI